MNPVSFRNFLKFLKFQELPKAPKCLLPQLNELLCRTECFYLPVNIMYLSELSSKREGFNLYNTT